MLLVDNTLPEVGRKPHWKANFKAPFVGDSKFRWFPGPVGVIEHSIGSLKSLPLQKEAVGAWNHQSVHLGKYNTKSVLAVISILEKKRLKNSVLIKILPQYTVVLENLLPILKAVRKVLQMHKWLQITGDPPKIKKRPPILDKLLELKGEIPKDRCFDNGVDSFDAFATRGYFSLSVYRIMYKFCNVPSRRCGAGRDVYLQSRKIYYNYIIILIR